MPSAPSTSHSPSKDSDQSQSKHTSQQQRSYIPSIYILRPPPAQYSPHNDEYCLTLCSQSMRGRHEQKEPWCRSICIRRVFAHEVQRVLTTHTFPISKFMSQTVKTEEVKIPLPPEGQESNHVFGNTIVKGLPPDLVSDALLSDDDPSLLTESESEPSASKPGETKHWKEGWYLWTSKSRWAAQEHMDKMTMPLETQHEWECFKQRRNEEWARENGVTLPRDTATAPFSSTSSHLTEEQRLQDEAWTTHQNELPYPTAVGQSMLVALPPPSPFPMLKSALDKTLKPTGQVLEIFQKSLTDGSQREFAARLLNKATTADPWIFARNAMTRAWQLIWNPKGEGDSPR